MSQEYRLDDVLQVLTAEDPLKTLTDDIGILSAMLVYCKTDYEVIARRIMNDKEKKNAYIKGLISLYPISSSIIEKVLLTDDEKVTDVSDYLDQYETSEVMKRCFVKFCAILTNGAQNCISDTKMLTQAIEMYDAKIAQYTERIKEARKYQNTQKSKHDEAMRLERELKDLQKEWAPDAIERRIQKTRAAIAQAKKDKEEPEKKIQSLEAELKEIKGSKNATFDQKLKALTDLLYVMPKDGSES